MARSASACEWCGTGAAPPAPPAISICCPPCSAWSTCCRAFSPRARTRAGSVRSIWSPIVHCVAVAHMPGDQSEGQLRDAVLPCSAADSLVQPGMTQHPDHLPHTLGDLRPCRATKFAVAKTLLLGGAAPSRPYCQRFACCLQHGQGRSHTIAAPVSCTLLWTATSNNCVTSATSNHCGLQLSTCHCVSATLPTAA